MNNNILLADEVWVATALLHRRHPERGDFAVAEIVRQAAAKKMAGPGPLRPGVQVHASQHSVANKPPNRSRHRMLVETSRGRRRLFRPGDPCHPDRRSGKHLPHEGDIPPDCRELLEWYRSEYAAGGDVPSPDPILSLRDSGTGVWEGENADSYVRRLREGWS